MDLPCLIDSVPSYGARRPFLRGKMVSGPAAVSDGGIVRDLACAGPGAAYLPAFFVEEGLWEGRLEELFPDIATEAIGIYAVLPLREYISPAAGAIEAACG